MCKGAVLLKAFSAFLKRKKKLSEASITSYVRDVRLFSAFLGKDPVKASKKDVRAFISGISFLPENAKQILRWRFRAPNTAESFPLF